jgi:hypothetical protein
MANLALRVIVIITINRSFTTELGFFILKRKIGLV